MKDSLLVCEGRGRDVNKMDMAKYIDGIEGCK